VHPFTYGQTVTLIRRIVSGTDPEYGNDLYSETREDVALCVIAPANSSETFSFTEQTDDTVMVYLPTGTDVSYLDAVLINGDKYEVMGNAQSFISPFSGHNSPVQVRVNRVTGASV
jgi:hypothetical protein